MATEVNSIGFRDVEWVADQLGLDKNTVYRYLNGGRLPGLQLGKKWLVDEQTLRDWLLREQRLQTEQRQLEHWLDAEAPSLGYSSGVATVMFTDLMGATAYLDRAGEDAALDLISTHHRIVTEALPAEDRTEPKLLGDGALVLFGSAVAAARTAIGIQRAYAAFRADRADIPALHIGLHTGEVRRGPEDFGGGSLFVAAHITALAGPGAVLLSSATAAALGEGHGLPLGPGREVELKDLSGRYTVHDLATQ